MNKPNGIENELYGFENEIDEDEDECEEFISDFCDRGLHGYCKMVGCVCSCHRMRS